MANNKQEIDLITTKNKYKRAIIFKLSLYVMQVKMVGNLHGRIYEILCIVGVYIGYKHSSG